MSLNFPANPEVGQTYVTDTYTYSFDGIKWTSIKRSVTNIFDNVSGMQAQTDLKIGDWCKVLEPLSEYIIGQDGEIDLDNGLTARLVNRENAAVLKNFGYNFKGYFGTRFTLETVNDVGISEDDRIYKYIGNPLNFPVTVSPAADPEFSSSLYEEVDLAVKDHSILDSRDAVDAHDTIYTRKINDEDELRAYPIDGYIGRTYETLERSPGSNMGGAKWESVLTSSVVPDNINVIQSTHNASISYRKVAGSAGHTIVGIGSPVGVKVGPIGTLYVNLNGGIGNTLWIKESGSGTTGWRAL